MGCAASKPPDILSSASVHPLKTRDSEARKTLGEGPKRFALIGERSIEEQIEALDLNERECFDTLKKKWEEKYPDAPFTDEMYLRFARCSPGAKKFSKKSSFKAMKKFDKRYLSLTAAGMKRQLMTKTLFPVPGFKTLDGHDVFYMRPSRYLPSETSTKKIIDNLAYCMNTMMEKESACTEGIAFLAYMNDWKLENFSVDYCYQFMMMLQGSVPGRVRLFLIVNPPNWFGSIWKYMKTLLADDFRKQVHMIPEADLTKFLPKAYTEMLPDDTNTGKASTDNIVADFITYRKSVES